MIDIINRPLHLMKETFIPRSYDASHFEMDWTMEAGGVVQAHLHRHADEYFTVTGGEVTFTVNGETIVKKKDETLQVPRMTPHSISNTSGAQIMLHVKYTPCAHTHKMFIAWAYFADEGSGMFAGMLKWWYVQEKLGWKKFSEPADGAGKAMFALLGGLATLLGALLGWKKYLEIFEKVN